uniref:uncharacterized protein LOC122609923 isoform X2 n=1 Tax=Erigeron canadensis TaxID=72917 RepID=UPI001CB89EFD|nr:uncharacterized protein LOC122609923 isoform X2 [Erigeron canadensis]
MSAEVKSYLLDSSSGATFTMVTRKEIRDMNNTRLAQKLMTSLWRLLKREKVRTDTNGTHLERWKRRWGSLMENCHEEDRVELENEMQMTRINSCWEDISVQIQKGKEVTCEIVSSLQEIKDVMIKLPTSKRAEMRTCFSSLCAEADAVVNNIIHRVTLKRSHFSAFFQEMASNLQPSL